ACTPTASSAAPPGAPWSPTAVSAAGTAASALLLSAAMGGRNRTGGQIVADSLRAKRGEAAFCGPGGRYLSLLAALYDTPTRLITCRHEAGAANMAVAYGKLTGRPGVCLVTRGPGATPASVGGHTT